MLLDQEFGQGRQDFGLLHLEGREAELNQHGLQKSGRRQLCLVELRDDDIRPQFLEEGLDQGRLARTDFPGDHDETVGEPDRRFHVRLRARVLFAQIEKLRIRAQAERQLGQFKEF